MATADHGTSPEFQRFLAGLGTLVETHASWVVLTESEAIKFKKPVDFGFLDFSTREQREACCRRELELNRRLAASVYKAVVPLYLGPSGYALGAPAEGAGGGELVDYAVVMRRLADRDRADVLLQAGRLRGEHVRRLAARLVEFHSAQPADPALAAYGSFEQLAHNVRENFAGLASCEKLPRAAWQPLEAAQLALLDRTQPLLEARTRGGHIRDGHGDLRLEHVYFEGDEVIIVDCIEFNDDFRYADTALDLAFLTMDLRRLRQPDLAEDFLAEVALLCGDYEAYALVDLYESYRATVRGKVAALRQEQLAGKPAAAAGEEAAAFLQQALAPLGRAAAPRLICLAGSIASGKSTLARGLSRALHCPVVDSDSTRKRLAGVDPWTSLAAAPFQEAYSAEASERTYERLREVARIVLGSGRSLIVDASFRSRRQRRAFAEAAAGVPCFFIECSAKEAVLRERLRRRAQGASQSDGSESLLPALSAAHEPIADGELERVLRCDTSAGGDEVLERALRFLAET